MEKTESATRREKYIDNSRCLRVSKEIFREIYYISKEEGVPMSSVANELLATALDKFQSYKIQ